MRKVLDLYSLMFISCSENENRKKMVSKRGLSKYRSQFYQRNEAKWMNTYQLMLAACHFLILSILA